MYGYLGAWIAFVPCPRATKGVRVAGTWISGGKVKFRYLPCKATPDKVTTLATGEGGHFPPSLSCRPTPRYGDRGAAARSVSSRSPIASHAVSIMPGND